MLRFFTPLRSVQNDIAILLGALSLDISIQRRGHIMRKFLDSASSHTLKDNGYAHEREFLLEFWTLDKMSIG